MASPPKKPADFSKIIRGALFKGFIIPVLVLAFFAAAPAWLNKKLRDPIRDSVRGNASFSESEKQIRLARIAHVDFAAVAARPRPGMEQVRVQMDAAGLTGQFQRLAWGFRISLLLVLILVGMVISIVVLNRRARRSRADLISSYRLAWKITVAAALAKVVLLIPLLAYGSFELTTLATGQYLPKLIAVIVIGGVVAIFQSVKILTRRVPLQIPVPLARAVSPEQAPRLWEDVRAAAARVGTEPPDSILLGMDHGFFVTEVEAIHHSGRSTGRTLHLSVPLMQQLSPDELLSIIGHELAHFRGEDTQLSRIFVPLRMKAQATLVTMARAGLVARSSFHTLHFFHGSFGQTEQGFSRERELAADQVGAELTSPSISAGALVKVHAAGQAFRGALRGEGSDPFAVTLPEMVRRAHAADTGFWTKLLERRSPHPLDSHPTLRVRLEALGVPADIEAAQAVSEAAPGETAAGRWLVGLDELLSGVKGVAAKAVSQARAVTLSYDTEEGKRVLDEQFPEIRWKARKTSVYLPVVLGAVGAAAFGTMAAAAPDVPWLLMLALALACMVPGVIAWKRHRKGEFVLRADSLTYTGWNRPLLFSNLEIARTTVRRTSGTIYLNFYQKAKSPNPWRTSPLFWVSSRVIKLNVGTIAGKPKETFQTIERYLFRKPAPPMPPG